MGDFLTETIFREERQDNIITRLNSRSGMRITVYKTETSLSEEMDIDPEYAALIVPTMVICKDFMDLFNAEALWMPGVSLLNGIAYDFGEKKNFIKSAHNFENDILVAARNIAKRYSTGKDHIKGTTDLALAIFDSMKKVHGMGDRESACFFRSQCSFMTVANISVWEMWQSVPIRSLWLRRLSDFPQKNVRSSQMRCATIPQNLFITARSQERSEWIVPYIF